MGRLYPGLVVLVNNLPIAGQTTRRYGRIAVADRKHAAKNPKAWFYEKPITLEDHQNSRWIVEPLHLLDCCQESDGGQAILVTTTTTLCG